jgi:hypothetical protein
MARVYPSGEAPSSLASEEGGSTPVTDPPDPWRRWTAAPEPGGPSLHLFPADPALPTLAAAMNLAALSGEDWPCPTADPTSVDLVHHGRQGAAVLRYGVRRTGSSPAPAFDHLYGKVYPDQATGQRVHGFLRSCANTGRVRVPESLGYSPRLNLGLTEALPGRPLLPDIVRSAARGGPNPSAPTSASAHAAVRASGRALAGIHGIGQATAPVRTIRHLTRELDAQLDVVQQMWPRTADDVGALLERIGLVDRVGPEGDGAASVLCHGDFTPSQVLLTGDTVCGVVDFDTVCWSEGAMDLGRFLAQLDLVVTKDCGQSAEHVRHQLADSFVAGYTDSAGVPVTDEFLDRIDLFRSLSLASTALHACRQLKERRLSLAMSLLSPPTVTVHHRTGKAYS